MILPYFACALLFFYSNTGFCSEECKFQERKYIIYGVNFGEGFNLKRDVYLRMANVVRQLREQGHNYGLVLPPWFTPHWTSKKNGSQAIRWSEFFDLGSLNRFVPVMEFGNFLKYHNNEVESILYLQHYEEGWDGGEYVLKYDIRPCMEGQHYFEQLYNGTWKSYVESLRDANFKRLRCLSIQGESSTLVKAILELEPNSKNVYIDRAETILHDNFGDKYYWQARRSMRYQRPTPIHIADDFRRYALNSTDDNDKTVMAERWEDQRPEVGSAVGGDYLAVHWRRRDFVHAHRNEVPSIKGTVKQIKKLTDSLKLIKVYVSTDAEDYEFRELDEQLTIAKLQVSRYKDNYSSNGVVSIIDQWICAHARYFIGTHVSTFSYRIHEDREILGFDPKTTFNRLCPDNQDECEQPAKWTIVYD